MKIRFYTEQVPHERVSFDTCCETMEGWCKGNTQMMVRSTHDCVFIDAGLGVDNIFIHYCPWCGQKIEVTVDLS